MGDEHRGFFLLVHVLDLVDPMRTESSPFLTLLLHCALHVDWCLQKSWQIALEKPGGSAFTLIFGILLENCPRLCFRTHSSRQCVDM